MDQRDHLAAPGDLDELFITPIPNRGEVESGSPIPINRDLAWEKGRYGIEYAVRFCANWSVARMQLVWQVRYLVTEARYLMTRFPDAPRHEVHAVLHRAVYNTQVNRDAATSQYATLSKAALDFYAARNYLRAESAAPAAPWPIAPAAPWPINWPIAPAAPAAPATPADPAASSRETYLIPYDE